MREGNGTAWSYLTLDSIVIVPDRRATCLSISLFEQQGIFHPLDIFYTCTDSFIHKEHPFPSFPTHSSFQKNFQTFGLRTKLFLQHGLPKHLLYSKYPDFQESGCFQHQVSLCYMASLWGGVIGMPCAPKAPVSGSAHLAVSRCYVMNPVHKWMNR